MDIVMPGLDGILATRKILQGSPDQLVVVLTSAGEEDSGLLALRAGAVGFLSKDMDSTRYLGRWRRSSTGRGPSRAR